MDKMNLICLLWLVGEFVFSSPAGCETKYDKPVDGLQVVDSMPQLVLLAASIDVSMFVCTTADLTALNRSARTATYTWHSRGQDGQKGQDIPVTYILSKDDPDRAVGFINSDTSTPIPVEAIYSDYKSCSITKLSLWSQEICLQWVTPGTENDVPEACGAAMNEKCGGGVVLYRDDVCK